MPRIVDVVGDDRGNIQFEEVSHVQGHNIHKSQKIN